MAEITAQGVVVEARPGLLIIRKLAHDPIEYTFEVKRSDARPGDYVVIYDDGQTEVRSRAEPHSVIEVPGAPQHDHS